MALGVTSHRAVVIESNYYHLVRMQDDTLGLDLTPFSDDSTFMKVPVSKTSLSHAKRLEIGELPFTYPDSTSHDDNMQRRQLLPLSQR